MTLKKDLIRLIPEGARVLRVRVSEQKAAEIVDTALGLIMDVVAKGGEVTVRGFGSFRQSRDPRSAAEYMGDKYKLTCGFKTSRRFLRILQKNIV